MKRMLRMLLLAVLMVPVGAGAQCLQDMCTITIQTMDSYGDGWLDGYDDPFYIDVYQGTTLRGRVTLASGYSGSQTVMVCPDDSVRFEMNGSDDYSESSFTILNGNGVPIISGADCDTYDDGDVITTAAVVCPTCIAPMGLAVATIPADSVTVTWSGSASEYELVIQPASATFDSTLAVSVYDTSYFVDTLTPGTSYRVSVRTVCTGEYSVWVSSVFAPGAYLMTAASDTLRTCGAVVYDDGGPAGAYGTNQNSTLVLLPTDSTAQWLVISGSSQTEGSYDYLTIYDGVGTSGTVLFCDNTSGVYSTQTFGPFTCRNGATIVFYSDYMDTYDGFEINVSCMDIPTCMPLASVSAEATTDSAVVRWPSAASAAGYEVAIIPQGDTIDAASPIAQVTDTTYSIDTLRSGIAYVAYVRVDCGSDYSPWTVSAPFVPGVYILAANATDTLRTCGTVVYDDGGPAGAYGSNQSSTLVLLPTDSTAQWLVISGSSQTEGSYDYLTVYDGVGTSGTVLFRDNTSGVSSTQTFGPFTCHNGATIVLYSDGSVTYDGFEINVSCMDIPTCIPLASVSAEMATTDSAVVRWPSAASAAGYEVAIIPQGDTIDAASPIAQVTDTTYSIDTLRAGITYVAYVRVDCGSDYSPWTVSNPFVPGAYILAANATDTLRTCGAVVYDDGGLNANYSHSQNSTLYLLPTDAANWLVLSGSSQTEGSWDYLTIYDGVGTSGTVLFRDNTSGVYSTQTFGPFTCENGATIVFHSDVSSAYAGFEISVSCVASGCSRPTDLVLVSNSTDSLVVAWTDSVNTGASYLVRYRNADSTAWQSMVVADTVAELYGLDGNTNYEVEVSALCADGDTSHSVSGTYHTACIGIDSLPWLETFDTWGSAFNSCWRKGSSSGSSYPSITSSGTNRYINCYSYNYYSYFILPGIVDSIAVNSMELEFAVRTYSSGGYSGRMLVGMVGTDSYTEGTAIDTLAVMNITNSSFEKRYLPLGNYNGDKRYILFKALNQGSVSNYVYIDSIELHRLPDCATPTGLVVSGGTDTTITIGWQGQAASYEYTVRTSTATVDSAVVNVTTATVGGMVIGTDYTIEVRSLCSSDSSMWTSITYHHGYCTPAPTSVDNNGITNVKFGLPFEQVDNSQRPTSAPYYGDYTAQSGAVFPGTTATVDITLATGYTYGTIIWVDWNRNFAFDGNEVVFAGMAPGTNPTVLHATFNVPATRDTGSYRMRIAGADSYYDSYVSSISAAAGADPCPTSSWTIVHDYTLHVSDLPSCMWVDSLQVSAVTSTSATISWVAGGTESQWVVDINGTSTTVSSPTYTANNLAPSTTYRYSVRALCSATDTSYAVGDSLTTLCADMAIPAAFDFDSIAQFGTVPCWIIVNGPIYRYSSVDYPTPMVWQYEGYAHSGNKSLFLYALDTVDAMIATNEIDHPGNALTVTFWTEGYLFADEAGTLQAGIMTDPSDTSTFVPYVTITDTTQVMREYEFSTTNRTVADHVYVAFRSTADSSNSYITIDDVAIEPYNPCIRPDSTAVSAITTTSATFTWQGAASGYQLAYGTGGNWDTVSVSTTTYTANNLIPASTYTAKVRSVCGSSYSSWREVPPFNTLCADITTYPYAEGFEEGLICWSPVDANNDGITFEALSNENGQLTAHTGNMMAISYSYYSGEVNADEYLVSPHFVLPNTTDSILFSFWFQVNSYWSAEHLEVLLSTTGTAVSDFTVMLDSLTGTSANAVWTQRTIDLSAYAGQQVYIALHHTGYDNDYILVDDIEVRVMGGSPQPACDAPLFGSVVEGETDITVSYTGTASAYEVAIVQGAWVAPAAGTATTQTTHTFSGLTAATQYSIGVRAVCGTETSAWVTTTATTAAPGCDAPTTLTVEGTTYTTVSLSWTSPSTDITAWQVNITGTNFDSTYAVSASPATLGGLTPGVAYTAKIRSLCNGQPGTWSTATASFAAESCVVPTNIEFADITGSTAKVSWTAEGVTEWTIEYGYHGFARGEGVSVSAQTNPYTLTGLEANTEYDVYVASTCEPGVVSLWSTVASFTTTDGEGIDGVDGMNVTLYPNPATDQVTVGGIVGAATVEVVDINGRTVSTANTTNGNTTLNVSGMAKGTYFVRITGEQASAVRKLIVK